MKHFQTKGRQTTTGPGSRDSLNTHPEGWMGNIWDGKGFPFRLKFHSLVNILGRVNWVGNIKWRLRNFWRVFANISSAILLISGIFSIEGRIIFSPTSSKLFSQYLRVRRYVCSGRQCVDIYDPSEVDLLYCVVRKGQISMWAVAWEPRMIIISIYHPSTFLVTKTRIEPAPRHLRRPCYKCI